MSKIENVKLVYVVWLLIQGTASFFIGGLLGCIVILQLDNYILGTIIAGVTGGLLLGLFHWKDKMTGRMTIAGLIAVPVGLLGSFILVEGLSGGFGLLFPWVAAYFENSNIPDIIAIILMGIVFGTVFGAIVYGRKSMGLFSIVCGVVSVPFGLLVGALNSGYLIKTWLENLFKVFGSIDLNFLAIIIEFGIGIGLCIGLFSMLKQKSIGGD